MDKRTIESLLSRSLNNMSNSTVYQLWYVKYLLPSMPKCAFKKYQLYRLPGGSFSILSACFYFCSLHLFFTPPTPQETVLANPRKPIPPGNSLSSPFPPPSSPHFLARSLDPPFPPFLSQLHAAAYFIFIQCHGWKMLPTTVLLPRLCTTMYVHTKGPLALCDAPVHCTTALCNKPLKSVI